MNGASLKRGHVNDSKTSIATSFAYDCALEDLLPTIADAGFTHVSLGAQEPHARYLGDTKRSGLRDLLLDCDLHIDTIHGKPLHLPQPHSTLAATVESAAFLDVSIVVVHAGPFVLEPEEMHEHLDAALATCEALTSTLRDTGVKLALENVHPGPATDLVRRALDSLPGEVFGFCYDSSHDQMGGPRQFTLLEAMSDRLLALHLSDRVREYVDHVIPGDGFIDWENLCGLIRNTDYCGPIALEVLMEHSRVKEKDESVRHAFAQAAKLYNLVFA